MLPHASLRYIAGIVHRDLQPENILVTSGPDGAVPRIVDIDHRADRFALGMTMFEMLTGGLLPFEDHVMEVVSEALALHHGRGGPAHRQRPDQDHHRVLPVQRSVRRSRAPPRGHDAVLARG